MSDPKPIETTRAYTCIGYSGRTGGKPMTDCNALAQRIVALGLAEYDSYNTNYYRFGSTLFTAEALVNDGRVVLALMEKYLPSMIPITEAYNLWDKGCISLAIAICEACCDALETDGQG